MKHNSYSLSVFNKAQQVVNCSINNTIKITNAIINFLIGMESKHNTNARNT